KHQKPIPIPNTETSHALASGLAKHIYPIMAHSTEPLNTNIIQHHLAEQGIEATISSIDSALRRNDHFFEKVDRGRWKAKPIEQDSQADMSNEIDIEDNGLEGNIPYEDDQEEMLKECIKDHEMDMCIASQNTEEFPTALSARKIAKPGW